MKFVGSYVSLNHIKHCWFAYSIQGNLDSHYYVPQCDPLPTNDWASYQQMTVPDSTADPIFISATVLSGVKYGAQPLNPYRDFTTLQPSATVANSVFVFKGNFDLKKIAAMLRTQHAEQLLRENRPQDSLDEASAAVALDPQSLYAHISLADAYARLQQPVAAQASYQAALNLASALDRDARQLWAKRISKRIQAQPR